MADYPQELAQDAVCQSHTGHMTGFWFLPAKPLRLNTNEWMNEWMWKVNPFWVIFPVVFCEVLCICRHLLQIRQYMCYRNDLAAFVTEILFPYFNPSPIFLSCQCELRVIPRDFQCCPLYRLGSPDIFTATAEFWLPAARCLQLRSCLRYFVM